MAIADERAEARTSALRFATEIHEDAVGGQEGFRADVAGEAGVAAPRPSIRAVANSRSDGIEREIAGELNEVPIALDEDGMEATLEEVTVEAVTAVEPLRIASVQALDAARDVRVARFDHQVVVIRHQAIAVTKPTEPFS